MTKFYWRDTAVSGWTAQTYDSERQASSTLAGTATTISTTVAGAADTTHEHGVLADGGAAHNSADWPTTTWRWSLDVATADSALTGYPVVTRTSSDKTTARQVDSTYGNFVIVQSFSGTGIKTSIDLTITDINIDSNRAASDLVGFGILASNSNMMTAFNLGIIYNDSDTWGECTGFATGLGGTLGVNAETGSAVAFGKKKRKASGTNLETDTAQVVRPAHRRVLGVNTEADAAQAFGRRKVKAVGTALEADSAVAITRSGQRVAINTVTETDAPVALGRSKRKSIGVATETDAAIALGKIDPIRASVSPALETDTPVSVGRTKRRALTPAVETDTATTFGKAKRRGLSPAIETDTAVSLSSSNLIAVGTVTETDTAQPVARVKRRAVGTAVEAETVLALGKRKTKATSLTTETDAAQSIGRRKTRAIGVTTTTDGLLAFGRRKSRTIGIPTEADAARPITVTTPFLGIAQESDLAMPIGRRKTRALPVVTNTVVNYGGGTYGGGPYGGGGDVAMPIRPAHRRVVSIALETDAALAPGRRKGYTLVPAGTVELARSLTVTVPLYRFEPPTYRRVINPPPLTRRVARPIQLDESSSVVRIGGLFTLVKIPTPEQLEAAGVEGEDYFIGGHVYTISHSLAAELQAAGYSSTEI